MVPTNPRMYYHNNDISARTMGNVKVTSTWVEGKLRQNSPQEVREGEKPREIPLDPKVV